MDRNRKWVARIWMKRAAGLREYIHDLQARRWPRFVPPVTLQVGGTGTDRLSQHMCAIVDFLAALRLGSIGRLFRTRTASVACQAPASCIAHPASPEGAATDAIGGAREQGHQKGDETGQGPRQCQADHHEVAPQWPRPLGCIADAASRMRCVRRSPRFSGY